MSSENIAIEKKILVQRLFPFHNALSVFPVTICEQQWHLNVRGEIQTSLKSAQVSYPLQMDQNQAREFHKEDCNL